MRCPFCGAAELVHDTRDIPYRYKGETTILTTTGDFCPRCGESIHDAEDSERMMREMRAFSKQVNAASVDPEFIAKVRKNSSSISARREKSSAAASMRFRGMRMARQAAIGVVKLLKVLDRHPDLLDEVKVA